MALGLHDLRFLPSQTVLVDKVFHLPQDGSFPPRTDLSLLRLSVPARFSRDICLELVQVCTFIHWVT